MVETIYKTAFIVLLMYFMIVVLFGYFKGNVNGVYEMGYYVEDNISMIFNKVLFEVNSLIAPNLSYTLAVMRG